MGMTVASPERLRGDLKSLMHRSGGVRDFSLDAAQILARAVPFDGVCLVTMDPATLLPTSEVVENGLPDATSARMTEIEIGGEDFNRFSALRSSGELAGSLSEATSGISIGASAIASSGGPTGSETSCESRWWMTRRCGVDLR